MTEVLQRLIEALREELKEYGEMLALLDQQQDNVMRRATDDLLGGVTEIQTQGSILQQTRAHRETCRQEVAMATGLLETASFADVLPRLPADYRPLLAALISENNELLLRVHQRSRQNHLLLSRSVKMMQQLITSLAPGGGPVYSEHGGVADNVVPVRPYYEAVG